MNLGFDISSLTVKNFLSFEPVLANLLRGQIKAKIKVPCNFSSGSRLLSVTDPLKAGEERKGG